MLARSTVSFVMHLARSVHGPLSDSSPQQRVLVRGVLDIEWSGDRSAPVPDTVAVRDLEILVRTGITPFRKMLTCERAPDQFASAHPIIVYDLNRDGYPEIIIPRWNRVYWNELGNKFREAPMLERFEPIAEAGVVVDVTSDGIADFVSINQSGQPIAFQGTAGGQFPEPAFVLADIDAQDALVITAGDIESDGDVDLWITQYKPSYVGGQMPTPYYDANDGSPSYLLKNDGDGTFVDATVESGLAKKKKPPHL